MWIRLGPRGESLPGVLASHSLNEDVLKAHLGLYRTIMFGESPLTRVEREAIAVLVSAANDCYY